MNAVKTVVEDLSLPQQQYVETIDGLMRGQGLVRMTDIAAKMAVSLPSASEAVARLEEMGVVCRGLPLGVALTPGGRQIANQLDRRHQALRRFMVDVMAMDPARSDVIACRLEHCVDGEFTDRLLDLARLLEQDYPWTLRGIAEHVRMRGAAAPPDATCSAGI